MQPTSHRPSQPHSKLGIVSFAISVLYGLRLLIWKILTSDNLRPDDYTGFLLVGLVALGLGIAGFSHRHRDRLFPMIGIIISSACLVTTLTDFWISLSSCH